MERGILYAPPARVQQQILCLYALDARFDRTADLPAKTFLKYA